MFQLISSTARSRFQQKLHAKIYEARIDAKDEVGACWGNDLSPAARGGAMASLLAVSEQEITGRS
jgi:hypothetical protein